jgi:hypothetical protein
VSAFNFLLQEKVKGGMYTILVNSELLKFLIERSSCFCSEDGLPTAPAPWVEFSQGEMISLPGSYHHRLAMLREQTTNYTSCRHFHSTWKESRGRCPKMERSYP